MNVLVDSSVWSLALRRTAASNHAYVAVFNELVRENRIAMIGPIRQEILSGIRHHSQFNKLKQILKHWRDTPVETRDYERAAECCNSCRAKGIQGTHVDFLICAIAERHQLAILTTDKDFSRYATILPIKLFKLP